MTSAPRACPNCGTEESRWSIRGVDYVNLSPLTGQCVDCLAAMTKELGPLERPRFRFDSRAAQERNDA